MSRLVRVVHPKTTVFFGPIGELTPDLIAVTDEGEAIERALAFVDEDGECHLFPLDESGVKRLRSMLSGLQLNSGI